MALWPLGLRGQSSDAVLGYMIFFFINECIPLLWILAFGIGAPYMHNMLAVSYQFV